MRPVLTVLWPRAGNRMRKAVVVGFDYHGEFLSNLINERSSGWNLRYYPASRLGTIRALAACVTADAIVAFGGPGPNMALADVARRRNIPVIVVWAGSDVLTAKRDPQLLELIKRYRFINVCDGEWLVDELRELGIEATYVPVTAVQPAPHIAPLPKEFSVLTYLPEPRRTFYGERAVYSLAREFPEIPFRVVGRGRRNPIAPANVEFLGHVNDIERRIDDSTVLLRLPEHDGKSMLVLEAMARGRHVIWNYEFPHVGTAPRTADAAALLKARRDEHERGELEPNIEGHAYVSRHFQRGPLAERFTAVLDEAVAGLGERVAGRQRVAISGLELFCAQMIEELERNPYGWLPEMLRTRARLEVVASMFSLFFCDVWYSIGSPIGDRWVHFLGRVLRKPRVIHWVGSDITALYNDRRLRRFCQQPHVHNLAEVDWTIDELRRLGIDATLAPLPPRLPASQPEPLPERFTVLLYLPRTRGDFYGRREYERLIRAFAARNVRFMVVGGGDFYAPPQADVIRLGWCASLANIYRSATVLIRFTKHDGLSLMTLEALTHGRHVLWSQDFPFTTQVRSYDDIQRAISQLLERFERGELTVQAEAASYVAETYSTTRCTARIAAAWENASREHTRSKLVMESS